MQSEHAHKKDQTRHGAILVDDGAKGIHKLPQVQTSPAVCVGGIKALLQRENLGDGNRVALGFAVALL